MAELDDIPDLLARLEQVELTDDVWEAVDTALQELSDALREGDDDAAQAAVEDLEDSLGGRRLSRGVQPQLAARHTLILVNRVLDQIGLSSPAERADQPRPRADQERS
ncbi:hypothetical protein Cs7R123_12560 [Catellatospora sp. TT07R-123]|uniref:CATRA system-associated protein n=1 Tax=Catellatospora sp. TT07R-123 TaxID=2733863 RepID=UPI001B2DDD21|nr:CATRA system-associated protein [Catellatospora sp. TT07R-123]GHJ43914.1 hypothetical protein Cs7R123_12560 [Catellatospora sp. TT07R-123]